MAAKSKSKQQEALQFLDDLDNIAPPPPEASTGAGAPPAAAAPKPGEGEAEFLAFIDEITQKSSEPTAPLERPSSRASLATPQGTIRRATERVRVGSPAPPSSAGSVKAETPTSTPARAATPSAPASGEASESVKAGSGWGWGSVWSSASAALQQARTAVDESVKHLPTEQATKWREEMMSRVPFDKEQLEKLGGLFPMTCSASNGYMHVRE